MNERSFARLETTELEEAVVGGAEGNRHTRRLFGGHAVRDLPAERPPGHP
jgi:hypothetical protein